MAPDTRPGEPEIEYNTPLNDEVKTTTCYMCACRCGIKVHLKDGKIRYIEGNPDHPLNKGVLCAKGSAGIMQHYSPARLSKPLKRVGERGSGEFKEIEWEEALETVTGLLSNIRNTDPRKLAFFTGRDQSQGLTGWWASMFGTPNYAAHGGFCSVNMAAGGLYSIGGSFWEFGEPDWPRAKYMMMFGVAEDHDSNPIKMGLSKIKGNGAKFVSVNPVRTGYSAIADEWIGIRPGTDGLFINAMINVIMKNGWIDVNYLLRYTNCSWLVIQNPGGADDGLFVRDKDGNPMVWNRKTDKAVTAESGLMDAALKGEFKPKRGQVAKPVFQLMAERYLDDVYSPENAAERCGVPADTIYRLAKEMSDVAFKEEVVIDQPWTDWTGQRHEKMIGRPVAMHAMRGISAHSNGFHTCRSLHMLQVLLGSIDTPGGFRYKPPFPRPIPPGPKPAGRPDQIGPNKPMPGPPLGFTMGPEDLIVDENGQPNRIDKAFSWEAPLSAHGMMHMVITNAWKGDPYPIDTLFMYMANMAWNSAMNTTDTMKMLTDKDPATGEYKIPNIIYSDAYFSETVAYADIILPDTTYLERWDAISLLDRPISDADGPTDSIRQPVLEPDRDVRAFQSVVLDLGARLGLPGMTNEDGSAKFPGGYPDYLVNHERTPGQGPLAGFRGKDGSKKGKGEPNPNQLQAYIDNGCFWHDKMPDEMHYFKHSNQAYLDYATEMGFIPKAERVVIQLYSEPMAKFRLAAQGHGDHQPPDEHRARVEKYFDPLPFWYEPFEDIDNDEEEFPLHAITQRPMAMYHSWGSQNAWLRQIHGHNPLYIPQSLADKHDLVTGDWAYLSSRHSQIKVIVQVMEGVNDQTVWTWNAIGKRSGSWNLEKDAPEAKKGFLMNHLISELLPDQGSGYRYAVADPVTGQAAWYDLRVSMRKAEANDQAVTEPQFESLPTPPGMAERPSSVRYGSQFAKTLQKATKIFGGKS